MCEKEKKCSEIEVKISRKEYEIQKLRDKSLLIFRILFFVVVMLIIIATFLHTLLLGVFAFIFAIIIWFVLGFIQMEISEKCAELKEISTSKYTEK